MIIAAVSIALIAVATLLFLAVMRGYLSPDVGVLARLQSKRYSLFEVVDTELAKLRSASSVSRERAAQVLRITRQQEHQYDQHAAEFVTQIAKQSQSPRTSPPRPLFVPLLSRAQKLFAVCDIDLARWVLNDPVTFERAGALEAFADAFKLQSVFTTKNTTLHKELKGFFSRKTNSLSTDQMASMMEILERRVDSMLSTWSYDAGVPFIPKVEGMVLEAYAEQFFGMKQFPNAEECGVLLKKVWQIKSLRNNIPRSAWDPLYWVRMRALQRQLFRIVDDAQALVDRDGSPVADEMAQVYRANSYRPGNLLNAIIPLYEAIARGVVYALIELASAPAIQKALRAEIATQRDELQYCRSTTTLLHRIWQETLRLRPPTPNQTRRVTTQQNALFPRGSKVVVVWSVFHMDPAVWGPRVNRFDPDRWLAATPEQTRNYNPFGTGAQRCVAMNYASFGGRVLIKRIVESRSIEHEERASTIAAVGTDRGYSRGPDPDAATLRFARLEAKRRAVMGAA